MTLPLDLLRGNGKHTTSVQLAVKTSKTLKDSFHCKKQRRSETQAQISCCVLEFKILMSELDDNSAGTII